MRRCRPASWRWAWPPRASTPEEMDAVVARDFAFWGPVVRTANITT